MRIQLKIMRNLIKNDVVKINILKSYKKKNISYTASQLSRILGVKFETTQKALEFFCFLGILKKEIKDHGQKQITYYDMTNIGKNLLIKSKKI